MLLHADQMPMPPEGWVSFSAFVNRDLTSKSCFHLQVAARQKGAVRKHTFATLCSLCSGFGFIFWFFYTLLTGVTHWIEVTVLSEFCVQQTGFAALPKKLIRSLSITCIHVIRKSDQILSKCKNWLLESAFGQGLWIYIWSWCSGSNARRWCGSFTYQQKQEYSECWQIWRLFIYIPAKTGIQRMLSVLTLVHCCCNSCHLSFNSWRALCEWSLPV